MNKYQRIVLFVTAALLTTMLLFPLFSHPRGMNMGYSFILRPPSVNSGFAFPVNTSLLGIQALIVAAAGGALLSIQIRMKML